MNPNGVILHESRDIVVIATGLTVKSHNAKTGGMVQVYILRRDMHPVEAVQTGADAAICGDCRHRGTLGKRRCYVNAAKGPAMVYGAYTRGSYRRVETSEYPELFAGKRVRLGAYGDPAFIPLPIVRAVVDACDRHTGYTHQWRTCDQDYARYLMASVDSADEARVAVNAGWRYFRVTGIGDGERLNREISCPASAEMGHKAHCVTCCLCDGMVPRVGVSDKRANVVIQDHSVIARRVPLVQIAGVGN